LLSQPQIVRAARKKQPLVPRFYRMEGKGGAA
jgi:hypothetical protein